MSLNGRSLIGVILILLGSLFVASNLGLIEDNFVQTVISYWPVLVILWGLNVLLNREDRGDTINGAIILFIGFLFLGRRFELFQFSWGLFWSVFWPVVIILVGVSMLSNRQGRGRGHYTIMGALEKTQEPWVLDDQSYVAFMGGVELDLTTAKFQKDHVTLDLTAAMGGIEITVPEDITVICKGTAILGGVDFIGRGQGGIFTSFSKKHTGRTSRTLTLYCRAFMGGIDIKAR